MAYTCCFAIAVIRTILLSDFSYVQCSNVDRGYGIDVPGPMKIPVAATQPLWLPPLPGTPPIDMSLSAQMCDSYGGRIERALLKPRMFPTLLLSWAALFPESKCGVQHQYISGGRTVDRGLSHVVALGRMNEDGKFSIRCGGSLIASKWVLTAAHCTHGISGGVTIARVGAHRLSDNQGMTIAIKRAIRHPSYKPPALYADIALLELETPVTFTTTLRPACLSARADYRSELVVLACGWGVTEFEGNESDALQEASLSILDSVECEKKHNRSREAPDGIAPSMICAGSLRNGRLQDTCRGDSGGPLQIAHPTWNCLNQVIGITSFGAGCAYPGYPGVYTKVAYYLDWIESIVWPNGVGR